MDKQEILALLLKYRQGKCSEEEIRKIHLWYESLNQEFLLSLPEHEKELIENRMLDNILTKNPHDEREVIVMPESLKWWKSAAFYSGIAACAIIAISYLLFFNNSKSGNKTGRETLISHASQSKLIIQKNETDRDQKIKLADNSSITLSPGSEVIYPGEFALDKREVQLTGNAFFEISKNPSKPFFVYSGKLITKVLGTSFRIKTNETDKAVEVEVVTGKVSVFENVAVTESSKKPDNIEKSNNGVVLTPNQRVTYFAESGHLMTSIVDIPVAIPEVRSVVNLDFNNAPLSEIMNIFHKEYGIEIMFANDHLGKCTFTGDVSDMPLYEKLALICKSNLAGYELKGTRILITGEGCD